MDDVHGASVVSNPESHSGDPSDYHGHGTHVAGIIAAQAFNGLGGVGGAFNTQIMAIRAAQYSGTLTVQDIAEGINYAVDNGAEVINMSFGGYQRSQIVIDALEVALNQAVLVAAAGNDSLSIDVAPSYPAALPWVLGVEASTPKDKLAGFSNFGYEVRAPGSSIYSTLPGDQYAAWSGTSMATPVVSSIAALMRSFYWQRDIYSSRFIMGSIAASGSGGDNPTGVVDAFVALTEPPTPGVTVYENWMFDDTGIDSGNDGDGRIDSGETVHLAIELINRSGMADNVTATLTARAQGAVMDDPYVTISTNTVDFGSIGPFALADNGLIWDNDGVIVGVDTPFVVTVDPSCPNDHVIPFVLTTTFTDGWDEDHKEYTRVSRFEYVVQRGVNVPRVVSEDLTLTSDQFWIVGSPVLIEEGATLRIEEGVELQFGAISDDPYNPGPQNGNIVVRGNLLVEGTQERPVSLFPSYLVSGQQTKIEVQSGGQCDLRYAKIRNPNMTGLGEVDHCYVDWDAYTSTFQAQHIAGTTFHDYRGNAPAAGVFDTVLFDRSWGSAAMNTDLTLINSVFLQDNQNNHPLSQSIPLGYHEELTELQSNKRFYTFLDPQYHEGDTYVILPMEWDSTALAELIANYFGGHLLSVHSEAEQQWVTEYLQMPKPQFGYDGSVSNFLLGATTYNASLDGNEGTWGEYRWVDGSPMDYTNWGEDQPAPLPTLRNQEIRIDSQTGLWSTRLEEDGGRWGGHGHPTNWPGYALKIPGNWSYEELMEPYDDGSLLSYVDEHYHSPVRYNAFLSKSWDPDVNHWMRITPVASTPEWNSDISENYWGTDTAALVQHMVYDYYDTFTTAHIDYGTPPANGYESTYPFVQSVAINDVPAESVPEIGAGPATFRLTFNRPMDPDSQPFVAFGPADPYTDFSVHPMGQEDVSFTVTLSQPSSQVITVGYATVDETAVAGVDYEATSGTLTFEPGEVQKTVNVPVIGDIWEESSKTFLMELSNPTVASLADGEGQGTINDDDPMLAIGDIEIVEGDSATSDATFTVTLSKECTDPVTVQYHTQDGTAHAGQEFESIAGTLTFAPGIVEQTVQVPVIGNLLHAPNRTFFVDLVHPTRASIAQERGTGTIIDNDPLISLSDASIVEGDTGMTNAAFTVTLSSAPLKTITVDYSTSSQTAMAGADFVAQTGTLEFLQGQPATKTILVPVLGDTLEEPNENFSLSLSGVHGAVLADVEAQGTIIADDGLLLSVDDLTVVEADGGYLDWSTFLGSDAEEAGYGMAIDADGNAWVTGSTNSAGWVSGGFDTSYNGGDDDAFIAKISPNRQLLWSTYLGGSNGDRGQDIAIDASGNIWIVGTTASPGWVSGGFDTSDNGGDDAFVAKLDSTGQLLWSSYLGGSGNEAGLGIATDSSGNVWLTGSTVSSGWVADGFDLVYDGGTSDGFVAKLSGDGGFLWSSYFGGTDTDDGQSVVVDAAGNGWVVGSSRSAGWVSGGYDTSHNGWEDAVVLNIASDGQLNWSSYFGSGGSEWGNDIAIAASDGVWLVGTTGYADWTSGGFDDTFDGNRDPFVMRLATDGQPLWSSYLPAGSGADYGVGVAVDDSGDAWVTGSTSGAWTSTGGFNDSPSGDDDAFIAKIDANGEHCLWTSYLGGSGLDRATDVAVDPAGRAWLLGYSESGGWAEAGFDTGLDGARDAFLAVVGDDGVTLGQFTVTLSESPSETVTVNYATHDDTAFSVEDYELTNGTLSFEPGGPTQQTVSVRIVGDMVYESDETFTLDLSAASGAFIATDQGIGTINNDDPLLSIDDVTVLEADSGTVDAVFTVQLSVAATRTITVDYSTHDGKAKAGEDYQATSGDVVLRPGRDGAHGCDSRQFRSDGRGKRELRR